MSWSIKSILLAFLVFGALVACGDKSDVDGVDGRDIVGSSPYVDYAYASGSISKNLSSYGGSANSTADQSAIFQKAIDDISSQGGGRLIVEGGTFRLMSVYMRSNVHIVVNPNVTFKPYYRDEDVEGLSSTNQKSIGTMFWFTAESSNNHSSAFIENCSIRGMYGRQFNVDFSDIPNSANVKVRFAIFKMVRNYSIKDVNVMDNRTVYCPIIFVPSTVDAIDGWELSRPTNGEVVNCSITKASSGYGLCQFHGVDNIYLDNIYAEGGVTLRLEPDVAGNTHGVYGVRAKNIGNERGRAAVMLQPHTAKNGSVKAQDIWSNSTGFGVLVREGFIDDQNHDNPDAEVGYFGDDTEFIRIHSVFGADAQVDKKDIWILEPNDVHYAMYRFNDYDYDQSFTGAAVAPVYDETKGSYKVTFSSITSSGFAHYPTSVLFYDYVKSREADKWKIVNALPCMQ